MSYLIVITFNRSAENSTKTGWPLTWIMEQTWWMFLSSPTKCVCLVIDMLLQVTLVENQQVSPPTTRCLEKKWTEIYRFIMSDPSLEADRLQQSSCMSPTEWPELTQTNGNGEKAANVLIGARRTSQAAESADNNWDNHPKFLLRRFFENRFWEFDFHVNGHILTLKPASIK